MTLHVNFPTIPSDWSEILYVGLCDATQDIPFGREDITELDNKVFLIRQAWEWDALEPEHEVFV